VFLCHLPPHLSPFFWQEWADRKIKTQNIAVVDLGSEIVSIIWRSHPQTQPTYLPPAHLKFIGGLIAKFNSPGFAWLAGASEPL
jgi:hypothetical protein